MVEAKLHIYFDPLKDDDLVLTVDDDRVYRVYFTEEKLSNNRRYSFTQQGRVDYTKYDEALKVWKHLKQMREEEFAARLERQARNMGYASRAELVKETQEWLATQV